ncbi:unnamed protein product [Amoebophrya sp. A25]|nr:unnamed protein product [Amoebophrya sp. A25]|eukprot:GSA25T00022508001.1
MTSKTTLSKAVSKAWAKANHASTASTPVAPGDAAASGSTTSTGTPGGGGTFRQPPPASGKRPMSTKEGLYALMNQNRNKAATAAAAGAAAQAGSGPSTSKMLSESAAAQAGSGPSTSKILKDDPMSYIALEISLLLAGGSFTRLLEDDIKGWLTLLSEKLQALECATPNGASSVIRMLSNKARSSGSSDGEQAWTLMLRYAYKYAVIGNEKEALKEWKSRHVYLRDEETGLALMVPAASNRNAGKQPISAKALDKKWNKALDGTIGFRPWKSDELAVMANWARSRRSLKVDAILSSQAQAQAQGSSSSSSKSKKNNFSTSSSRPRTRSPSPTTSSSAESFGAFLTAVARYMQRESEAVTLVETPADRTHIHDERAQAVDEFWGNAFPHILDRAQFTSILAEGTRLGDTEFLQELWDSFAELPSVRTEKVNGLPLPHQTSSPSSTSTTTIRPTSIGPLFAVLDALWADHFGGTTASAVASLVSLKDNDEVVLQHAQEEDHPCGGWSAGPPRPAQTLESFFPEDELQVVEDNDLEVQQLEDQEVDDDLTPGTHIRERTRKRKVGVDRGRALGRDDATSTRFVGDTRSAEQALFANVRRGKNTTHAPKDLYLEASSGEEEDEPPMASGRAPPPPPPPPAPPKSRCKSAARVESVKDIVTQGADKRKRDTRADVVNGAGKEQDEQQEGASAASSTSARQHQEGTSNNKTASTSKSATSDDQVGNPPRLKKLRKADTTDRVKDREEPPKDRERDRDRRKDDHAERDRDRRPSLRYPRIESVSPPSLRSRDKADDYLNRERERKRDRHDTDRDRERTKEERERDRRHRDRERDRDARHKDDRDRLRPRRAATPPRRFSRSTARGRAEAVAKPEKRQRSESTRVEQDEKEKKEKKKGFQGSVSEEDEGDEKEEFISSRDENRYKAAMKAKESPRGPQAQTPSTTSPVLAPNSGQALSLMGAHPMGAVAGALPPPVHSAARVLASPHVAPAPLGPGGPMGTVVLGAAQFASQYDAANSMFSNQYAPEVLAAERKEEKREEKREQKRQKKLAKESKVLADENGDEATTTPCVVVVAADDDEDRKSKKQKVETQGTSKDKSSNCNEGMGTTKGRTTIDMTAGNNASRISSKSTPRSDAEGQRRPPRVSVAQTTTAKSKPPAKQDNKDHEQVEDRGQARNPQQVPAKARSVQTTKLALAQHQDSSTTKQGKQSDQSVDRQKDHVAGTSSSASSPGSPRPRAAWGAGWQEKKTLATSPDGDAWDRAAEKSPQTTRTSTAASGQRAGAVGDSRGSSDEGKGGKDASEQGPRPEDGPLVEEERPGAGSTTGVSSSSSSSTLLGNGEKAADSATTMSSGGGGKLESDYKLRRELERARKQHAKTYPTLPDGGKVKEPEAWLPEFGDANSSMLCWLPGFVQVPTPDVVGKKWSFAQGNGLALVSDCFPKRMQMQNVDLQVHPGTDWEHGCAQSMKIWGRLKAECPNPLENRYPVWFQLKQGTDRGIHPTRVQFARQVDEAHEAELTAIKEDYEQKKASGGGDHHSASPPPWKKSSSSGGAHKNGLLVGPPAPAAGGTSATTSNANKVKVVAKKAGSSIPPQLQKKLTTKGAAAPGQMNATNYATKELAVGATPASASASDGDVQLFDPLAPPKVSPAATASVPPPQEQQVEVPKDDIQALLEIAFPPEANEEGQLQTNNNIFPTTGRSSGAANQAPPVAPFIPDLAKLEKDFWGDMEHIDNSMMGGFAVSAKLNVPLTQVLQMIFKMPLALFAFSFIDEWIGPDTDDSNIRERIRRDAPNPVLCSDVTVSSIVALAKLAGWHDLGPIERLVKVKEELFEKYPRKRTDGPMVLIPKDPNNHNPEQQAAQGPQLRRMSLVEFDFEVIRHFSLQQAAEPPITAEKIRCTRTLAESILQTILKLPNVRHEVQDYVHGKMRLALADFVARNPVAGHAPADYLPEQWKEIQRQIASGNYREGVLKDQYREKAWEKLQGAVAGEQKTRARVKQLQAASSGTAQQINGLIANPMIAQPRASPVGSDAAKFLLNSNLMSAVSSVAERGGSASGGANPPASTSAGGLLNLNRTASSSSHSSQQMNAGGNYNYSREEWEKWFAGTKTNQQESLSAQQLYGDLSASSNADDVNKTTTLMSSTTSTAPLNIATSSSGSSSSSSNLQMGTSQFGSLIADQKKQIYDAFHNPGHPGCGTSAPAVTSSTVLASSSTSGSTSSSAVAAGSLLAACGMKMDKKDTNKSSQMTDSAPHDGPGRAAGEKTKTFTGGMDLSKEFDIGDDDGDDDKTEDEKSMSEYNFDDDEENLSKMDAELGLTTSSRQKQNPGALQNQRMNKNREKTKTTSEAGQGQNAHDQQMPHDLLDEDDHLLRQPTTSEQHVETGPSLSNPFLVEAEPEIEPQESQEVEHHDQEVEQEKRPPEGAGAPALNCQWRQGELEEIISELESKIAESEAVLKNGLTSIEKDKALETFAKLQKVDEEKKALTKELETRKKELADLISGLSKAPSSAAAREDGPDVTTTASAHTMLNLRTAQAQPLYPSSYQKMSHDQNTGQPRNPHSLSDEELAEVQRRMQASRNKQLPFGWGPTTRSGTMASSSTTLAHNINNASFSKVGGPSEDLNALGQILEEIKSTQQQVGAAASAASSSGLVPPKIQNRYPLPLRPNNAGASSGAPSVPTTTSSGGTRTRAVGITREHPLLARTVSREKSNNAAANFRAAQRVNVMLPPPTLGQTPTRSPHSNEADTAASSSVLPQTSAIAPNAGNKAKEGTTVTTPAAATRTPTPAEAVLQQLREVFPNQTEALARQFKGSAGNSMAALDDEWLLRLLLGFCRQLLAEGGGQQRTLSATAKIQCRTILQRCKFVNYVGRLYDTMTDLRSKREISEVKKVWGGGGWAKVLEKFPMFFEVQWSDQLVVGLKGPYPLEGPQAAAERLAYKPAQAVPNAITNTSTTGAPANPVATKNNALAGAALKGIMAMAEKGHLAPPNHPPLGGKDNTASSLQQQASPSTAAGASSSSTGANSTKGLSRTSAATSATISSVANIIKGSLGSAAQGDISKGSSAKGESEGKKGTAAAGVLPPTAAKAGSRLSSKSPEAADDIDGEPVGGATTTQRTGTTTTSAAGTVRLLKTQRTSVAGTATQRRTAIGEVTTGHGSVEGTSRTSKTVTAQPSAQSGQSQQQQGNGAPGVQGSPQQIQGAQQTPTQGSPQQVQAQQQGTTNVNNMRQPVPGGQPLPQDFQQLQMQQQQMQQQFYSQMAVGGIPPQDPNQTYAYLQQQILIAQQHMQKYQMGAANAEDPAQRLQQEQDYAQWQTYMVQCNDYLMCMQQRQQQAALAQHQMEMMHQHSQVFQVQQHMEQVAQYQQQMQQGGLPTTGAVEQAQATRSETTMAPPPPPTEG